MSAIPEDVLAAITPIADKYSDYYIAYSGLIEAFAEAVMAERERCAKLLEEGFDRPVGKPYAEGHRSKNDECPHGRYMYEDCELCCAIAIRSGLTS